jgi:hypothetical protein
MGSAPSELCHGGAFGLACFAIGGAGPAPGPGLALRSHRQSLSQTRLTAEW